MTKTDNGMEFPAEAYLVVPDADKPSTWKLRIWETPENKITVPQLGRAAAALGPGFRGNRVDLPEDERRHAARKLIRLYRKMDVEDADIPEHLWEIAGMSRPRFSEEYVEREAMLFEAGDYPDKGVSVSEQHIENLVKAPLGDVPILVEHTDSPIRLGRVIEIFKRGKQLWGKLHLLPEADALLEKLGVKGVSIRVPRTFDRLIEVSITGSPRVRGAQIFTDGEILSFGLGEQPPQIHEKEVPEKVPEVEQMSEELQKRFASQIEELRRLYEQERERREQIEAELNYAKAAQRVDELVQSGQMPPAFREIVIAALVDKKTVTFASGGQMEELSLGEALLKAFAAQPRMVGVSLTGWIDEGEDLVRALQELGFDEQTARLGVKQKEVARCLR